MRAGALAFFAACVLNAQTLPGGPGALPDGPGKDTFESVCSVCHSPVAVIGLHKTKAEWKSKVNEMLQEQTDVSASDVTAVIEYLSKNFPAAKVNVNKAAASEMETALGLSSKEAAAIVQYREEKGGFKAVDDLKKVPGLDATKIEANRQVLGFE